MKWFVVALVLCLGSQNFLAQENSATLLATTPPMGWNSWDGYGATINEAQFKANVEWFAKNLKPSGWQYVVIDIEWFMTNPSVAENMKASQFNLDRFGRYTPAANRFPSSANDAGFKPLAGYVHSLGLKFGIHVMQGIPKQAFEKNLPIEGSSFHAADAADKTSTCPWNSDNYGANAQNPAAQAYYDSIARLYASWDVDFVKVDCIASRPYHGDDIRMLGEALRKTGRPIVLSLSPGEAPIDKIDEMAKSAQMWRISDDVWDVWHSDVAFPQGVSNQFVHAAKWAGKSGPGRWADADMLPIGHLGPSPGWGNARDTKLTHDEQRTMVTLWCMFPSPLMVGGELPSADDWMLSLLTNPEVLEVDQHSTSNHPVITTEKTAIWIADAADHKSQYVAVFNLSDSEASLHYAWKDLGLMEKAYRARDLWAHKDIGTAPELTINLPPHASILYRLSPAPANH